MPQISIKWLFLLIFLAVWPVSTRAQTLDEVLRVVFDTNPDIRAARARQKATAEATNQARSGLLPQISGEASYGSSQHDQVLNSDLFAPGGGAAERDFSLNPATAAVTANQTIFSGFRNLNAIKQARAIKSAGEAQLREIEQEVLLEAATAYFQVVLDVQLYEANKANRDVVAEQLKHAKARLRAGDITGTDVSQAEARLSRADAELSAAQASLAESRANLRKITGESPGTLDDSPSLPPLPESEQVSQEIARELAPSIAIAKQNELASRRQIAIENAEFAPTISLGARYQYSDEPSSFIQRDEEFSYGVRATVPIFRGGLRFSKSRAAKALNRRDKELIVAAERDVFSKVSVAWNEIITARIRFIAAQRQVEANTNAFDGVNREWELGVRTTLDVLNAGQEVLNAQIARASARRDEYVAAYGLLAAMGMPLIADATETAFQSEPTNAPGAPSPVKNAGVIEAVAVNQSAPLDIAADGNSEPAGKTAVPAPVSTTPPVETSTELIPANYGHIAQIGAFSTEEAARRAVTVVTTADNAELAALVAEYGADVVSVQTNSGALFRTFIGPMPFSQAKKACGAFPGDCFVSRR